MLHYGAEGGKLNLGLGQPANGNPLSGFQVTSYEKVGD